MIETTLTAPRPIERGIVIRPNTSENSGLHGGIWRRGPGGRWGWDGGADDRREGVVAW